MQVTYLGYVLNECMSNERMTLKLINKTNGKLKFLCMKNEFLAPAIPLMFCNALIQPHFDYSCVAWSLNLIKET